MQFLSNQNPNPEHIPTHPNQLGCHMFHMVMSVELPVLAMNKGKLRSSFHWGRPSTLPGQPSNTWESWDPARSVGKGGIAQVSLGHRSRIPNTFKVPWSYWSYPVTRRGHSRLQRGVFGLQRVQYYHVFEADLLPKAGLKCPTCDLRLTRA